MYYQNTRANDNYNRNLILSAVMISPDSNPNTTLIHVHIQALNRVLLGIFSLILKFFLPTLLSLFYTNAPLFTLLTQYKISFIISPPSFFFIFHSYLLSTYNPLLSPYSLYNIHYLPPFTWIFYTILYHQLATIFSLSIQKLCINIIIPLYKYCKIIQNSFIVQYENYLFVKNKYTEKFSDTAKVAAIIINPL